MAMTSAMEDIDYNRKNFTIDCDLYRHPLQMTEGHYKYHLYRDEVGQLHCRKNNKGEFIRSPRSLSDTCIHTMVIDPLNMAKVKNQEIPFDLYPMMLTEAIYQRELHAITNLLSTWPTPVLTVHELLPLEDYIEPNYVTAPVNGLNMTLLDAFIFGLLNQKPESRLKFLDFTKFDKDKKLCKELCRLPLLWMRPEDRCVEDIHSYLKGTIEISKDKVQRFINRITVIYSDMEPDLEHGNMFGPITIMLDLKMNMDDVPIGLALQHITPFRFVCNKLWMQSIPEVALSLQNINKILDPLIISHFEMEDNQVSTNKAKQLALIRGLNTMPNLSGLSLSNTLDVTVSTDIITKLNRVLRLYRNLRKLNLSYCNLKSHISTLLAGIRTPMIYLNLRDCRLTEDDLTFLKNWPSLNALRELNISRNNLSQYHNLCLATLSRMDLLACFSSSYCSLSLQTIKTIVHECQSLATLKVLCIQNFTPPSWEDLHSIIFEVAKIQSLQKCIILPEAYAFPGNNESDRSLNKSRLRARTYRYLKQKGRPDILLE
ncbi:leucine-rich repeat-containing protein 14-like [Tubulanus polymorphus]|uniref:leucine-rich repeat-containing protein 14-like n=1 Tax=Tubulanus polymorphus TaxID=672921 RepID=UPI003DA234FC